MSLIARELPHKLPYAFPLQVYKKEQNGGGFSLVTGGLIEQQCRTEFCEPKYARNSWNLATFVESGFWLMGCNERAMV